MRSVAAKYRAFRAKYIVQVRREHEYVANKYYAHVLDPFFTKLVYDLKMTPNMVTIVSGSFGLLTCAFFLCGQWKLAALSLQLHYLFDCADGNLARLTRQTSTLGAKLDKTIDQLVRFGLFFSLAVVADTALWIRGVFFLTIYVDLLVVSFVITPFSRKHKLVRAPWKQWFLDRGIIPAFDIFMIYILISLCAWFGHLNVLIILVIVGKNADWLYRVWECCKTKIYLERNQT